MLFRSRCRILEINRGHTHTLIRPLDPSEPLEGDAGASWRRHHRKKFEGGPELDGTVDLCMAPGFLPVVTRCRILEINKGHTHTLIHPLHPSEPLEGTAGASWRRHHRKKFEGGPELDGTLDLGMAPGFLPVVTRCRILEINKGHTHTPKLGKRRVGQECTSR